MSGVGTRFTAYSLALPDFALEYAAASRPIRS
jgi:hypothetical protein